MTMAPLLPHVPPSLSMLSLARNANSSVPEFYTEINHLRKSNVLQHPPSDAQLVSPISNARLIGKNHPVFQLALHPIPLAISHTIASQSQSVVQDSQPHY